MIGEKFHFFYSAAAVARRRGDGRVVQYTEASTTREPSGQHPDLVYLGQGVISHQGDAL